MTRARLWGLAGALVIFLARLALPLAPPMYEGVVISQPYRYCNPPPNLAGSNQPPQAGAGDMQATGDTNQLGSPVTADNQLLTFFAKGALQAPGAKTFHVELKPNCSPPAPPAGNQAVGNAYDITITGQPGDLAVTFAQPAQVLLRTPPVQYTGVELYYDGTWHTTQWGQQGDTANITLNHAGTLATFDNGSKNPRGKPQSQSPGIVTIVEVVLVSAALAIVVAAIVVQQRRARATAPARPPGGGAKRKAQGPRSRKQR